MDTFLAVGTASAESAKKRCKPVLGVCAEWRNAAPFPSV